MVIFHERFEVYHRMVRLMYTPTKYDEIEQNLYQSPLMEVEKQQNEMIELILITIVIALTLNLVSDVIWSIQGTQVWSGIILLLSFLLTVAVFLRILKKRFGRVCRISRTFHITVAWDQKMLDFPNFPYIGGYTPQSILHYASNRLDKVKKRNLSESIAKMPLSSSIEFKPVPHRIILDMIYKQLRELPKLQGRLPGAIRHADIQGNKQEQILVFTKKDDPVMILPGTFDATFTTGEYNSGKLIIEWNKSWRGKLAFEISNRTSEGHQPRTIPLVLPVPNILGLTSSESVDERNLIILDYDITVSASFNPFILAFNRYRTRELLDWTKDVIDHFWRMDWGYTFHRSARSQRV